MRIFLPNLVFYFIFLLLKGNTNFRNEFNIFDPLDFILLITHLHQNHEAQITKTKVKIIIYTTVINSDLRVISWIDLS